MQVENATVSEPQLQPLLRAAHVTKLYRRGSRFTSKLDIVAIEDVNLALFPKSTLAVVGKSGSGKSTLARCLAGLESPDSGEICVEGRNLPSLRGKELKRVRRNVQLIWQHSATAMNPRLTALETVLEPLRIQGVATKERRERGFVIFRQLSIPEEWANRLPHALSGGQRQRLALARALILNPKVLILDEALTGLDLPAQAQIVDLLLKLRDEFSLAQLFISHDLPMAASLAHTIAVIDTGRIVEMGTAAEICSHPQCACTRELVACTPGRAAKLSSETCVF